jgi:hypothetical protein
MAPWDSTILPFQNWRQFASLDAMKSTYCTIAFALIVAISNAQVIRIYKDGQQREATVKMLSDQGIYTGKEWIERGSYDSIKVMSDGPYRNEIKKFLDATTPVISPLVVTESEPQVAMPDFNKFATQRSTAKVFQFIGIGLIGVSSYLAIQYDKQNLSALQNASKAGKIPDMKYVPKELPLAGLGMMGIGILIDLDASKHLTKH